MPLARISLTLSCPFSLSFIAFGKSSGLHPVSSHSCCMYVRAGCPAFAWPYVGVYGSISLVRSSLLLQQCPACLVGLTWIVFVMGGRWPYRSCLVRCCRQDFFNNARNNIHKLQNKNKNLSKKNIYVLCFDLFTRPKMPFEVMHRKEVTHSNGSYERKTRGRKLADEMGRGKKKKIPLYSHRLTHRKRVTCELHDSYFRSMTITQAISKIAEVTHPDRHISEEIAEAWRRVHITVWEFEGNIRPTN